MGNDEWRHRELVVTVHEHCPECKQLKPEVKERTYFMHWMQTKTTCCPDCFLEIERKNT
jgi:hypothetical protein